MKNLGAAVTLSAILLLSSCAPPEPAVDVAAETAALREAAAAYHAATEGSDIETFVALNATDILMMPPNAPSAQGRDAIREVVAGFMEMPNFQIRFDLVAAEVATSGDIGFTLANGQFSFQGPDGLTIEDSIRDFHLWKKDAAGAWKVAYDIWNSEAPLAGTTH